MCYLKYQKIFSSVKYLTQAPQQVEQICVKLKAKTFDTLNSKKGLSNKQFILNSLKIQFNLKILKF